MEILLQLCFYDFKKSTICNETYCLISHISFRINYQLFITINKRIMCIDGSTSISCYSIFFFIIRFLTDSLKLKLLFSILRIVELWTGCIPMSSDTNVIWFLMSGKRTVTVIKRLFDFFLLTFVAILFGISDTVIVQIVSRENKATAYIGKMDSSRRPILR